MGAKQELKVLELDLSGADIMVGVEKLLRYDVVRMLEKNGVKLDKGPRSAYESGKLQRYLQTHLEKGRNYIVIDGSLRLDSQMENPVGKRVSIEFDYCEPDDGRLYLQITDVCIAKHYGKVGKAGVKELGRIVKKMGAEYSQTSEKFFNITRIGDIEGAGPGEEASPVLPEVAGERGGDSYGWENINKNIKMKFKPAAEVVQPKINLVKLEGFRLQELEETFSFPEYQRKLVPSHVMEIAKAIMTNKFHDPVIDTKGGKRKDRGGRWDAEDGKQSLHALRLCRDRFGLETYNIYVAEHVEGESDNIFRRLNMGKHHTPNDKLNALDKRLPYFAKLGKYLSHYYDAGKFTFVEMGHAYMYAKSKRPHTTIRDVEGCVPSIKPGEIEKMKNFLAVSASRLGNGPAFWRRKGVFRNLFRVYMEKGMGETEFRKTLDAVRKDSRAFRLSRSSNTEDYIKLYEIVIEDAEKSNKAGR